MTEETLVYEGKVEGEVVEVKVKEGSLLSQGKLVLLYKEKAAPSTVVKFKSVVMGRVVRLLARPGDSLTPGSTPLLRFTGGCSHPTIMRDLCAECGADLRRLHTGPGQADTAKVAMVHSIPELKVSNSEAKKIGLEDQGRLTVDRKLVLLVDLDQTLIHTTNDNIPPNLKDVYHFQLYGAQSPWYHTRVRPGTAAFLRNISHMYELHICTFGARLYAHTIAGYLDPDKKYFR